MQKPGKQILKCGCVPNAVNNSRGDIPWCLIHDCGDVLESQPNLADRQARCTYFGTPVKTGMYNGNCCQVCGSSVNHGNGLCNCQRESATSLWFFKVHPDQEFDEFYCACHGAD